MDISDGLKRAYQGVSKGASSINEWGEGVSNKMANAQFEDGALNILPTLNNPGQAAKRFGSWFNDQINTAAGYSDPYDNANPLIGPSMEKQTEAGLNLAGLLQTGAMPFAPKSAGGTLGTFIGPKAANWDKSAAEKAAQLLDDGVDPAQVWKEHLIGRMPDNALFREIDDSAAFLEHAGQNAPKYAHRIQHDDLFDEYPAIKKYQQSLSLGTGSGGHFADKTIVANGNTGNELKSTTLHELQHAIQQREGWARGGMPDGMTEEAIDMLKDDIKKGIVKDANEGAKLLPIKRFEAYQRLTGEAQARATQDRMNLNMDERRNSYPLAGDKLSDIPLQNLINRYGDNGPNMSTSLPETDFSRAHAIAQKNAALPVEQGGLGLHPDNTAMERARALGFETDVYHASRKGDDINEFGNRVEKTSMFNGLGVHSGTRESAIQRAEKSREVSMQTGKLKDDQSVYYPLSIKTGKNPGSNDEYESEFLLDRIGKEIKTNRDTPEGRKAIQQEFFNRYDSLPYINDVEDKGSISFISPPKNIRSRFAAFDPMKKDSANILASLLAATLVGKEAVSDNNE